MCSQPTYQEMRPVKMFIGPNLVYLYKHVHNLASPVLPSLSKVSLGVMNLLRRHGNDVHLGNDGSRLWTSIMRDWEWLQESVAGCGSVCLPWTRRLHLWPSPSPMYTTTYCTANCSTSSPVLVQRENETAGNKDRCKSTKTKLQNACFLMRKR